MKHLLLNRGLNAFLEDLFSVCTEYLFTLQVTARRKQQEQL